MTATETAGGAWRSLVVWARMVKLSHTVFALPFAFAGATLAAFRFGLEPVRLVWIAVCMFAARNAAMGFNRLVDERFDAENPRTSDRELPRGALSRPAVWTVTIVLAAVFVAAAFRLGPLTGALSVPALIAIGAYSFFKRFSWTAHLALGAAIAIAPVGGWLAVAGRFHPTPLWLGLAVACWVAGFDVLYALQDRDFDRARGLHSIPVRFGVRGSLTIARLLHAVAWLVLGEVGRSAGLFPVYAAGWIPIGALLVYEHRLVRPDDLSRLGVAFLNLNALIAFAYLLTVLVSGWMR